MPIILDVPYEDKDEAKKLGARWDTGIKKWYIPDGISTEAFIKWLPCALNRKATMDIQSPLYLVQTDTICWRCEGSVPVIGIIASDVKEYDEVTPEGPLMLTYVESLPAEILHYIKERCPDYKYNFSKKAGLKYHMNCCPSCGVGIGDNGLSHPGSCLVPLWPEDCSDILIETMPFSGTFPARAQWAGGVDTLMDLIL
jgi:hypothetical protein